VDGAAAPDVAVDELAAEGRACPVLARRRDDVHVSLQQQRWPVAAYEASHEVRAAGRLRVELGLDAGVLEQPADELDAVRLVARRIRRIEADQALEKLAGAQSFAIAASRPSTSSAVL